MEIELHNIKVGEVVKDFIDDPELGCRGYGGRLNIRPPFQREFVYNEKQREEVIRTVKQGFPLNVMYWLRSGDGNFEMLDGQQRTISLCQYVNNSFSLDHVSFQTLPEDEQKKILDYKLMIYICEGEDSEKLKWFEIINVAGEKLTRQEALNAIYACTWLTDAKKFFSKPGCPAQARYEKYLNGKPKRQEFLATALRWIAARDGLKDAKDYMDLQKRNHTPDASELWEYFEAVFSWVKATFPNQRREMKGLDWGLFYNEYSKESYDAAELEKKISRLIKDREVTNKRGIYQYLLSGKEKYLSLRQFDDDLKAETYERQGGLCAICGEHFELEEMEGDHIKPWSEGGKTTAANCQMLCKACNRAKGKK